VEIAMVGTFSDLIEDLICQYLLARESIKSGKASNRTYGDGLS
jgi:hypothetical protein